MDNGNLAPHLVPQPEICVECMMRDRDMIDIDVTSPGIWARGSDGEGEEWEEDSTPTHGDSEDSGRVRDIREGRSRDSHGARSSGYGSISQSRISRRRTRPLNLTVENLKVWTNMVRLSSH